MSGPDSDPIRLGGVPEHFNLPWRLALESGVLDGSVDATWTDQPGGTGAMVAALAAGELDVVSILTEGTVAAVADGLAATIVQTYVASPLQWGVHVPAGSDLAELGDCAGRRVAISRRLSGSHLMAHVQADRHGWPLDESQFVLVGGLDGAREAFAAGEADVFLWDRYMTQPLVDAGEFRRVGVEPTPWPSFVIAARTDTLLGRTTEVGTIIDAVVAEATALHHRADRIELVTSRYGLDAATAAAWFDSTEFAPRAAVDQQMLADCAAVLASVVGPDPGERESGV